MIFPENLTDRMRLKTIGSENFLSNFPKPLEIWTVLLYNNSIK